MTHHEEHHGNRQEEHVDATADVQQAKAAQHDDHDSPATANEATPDGQFDDQKMPTTDGEPTADDDPAASAGAESAEEGEAAMRAAEEATEN